MSSISKNDILEASSSIREYIHRTPVLTCKALDALTGATLFFKCENFQKVGAFKARGAANAVLSLPENECRNGVATHSSGNHAAALSLAAKNRGIPAYIVMPSNSSPVKVDAVRSYGGQITFCEPNLESRESTLQQVLQDVNAVEIHPYNNLRIIAGQATAALELIQDAPGMNALIAPVGGGGLLSGTSLSAYYFARGIKTYGAEPLGADDAFRSFHSGKIIPSVAPLTIADGLRTSLGSLTFPIIREHVTDILRVSEEEIVFAMRLVWERMKIIIEPSSAVPLAAVMRNRELFEGKTVGIILSGGNVDLSSLPWQ